LQSLWYEDLRRRVSFIGVINTKQKSAQSFL